MPEYGINESLQKSLALLDYPEIQIKAEPLAKIYLDVIKKHIESFQQTLDADHDVGLLLTNFGQSVIMEVTNISYEDGSLMVFRGFVNGRDSTLIQHINQLNFLITSVPKEPEKPHNTIGFIVG